MHDCTYMMYLETKREMVVASLWRKARSYCSQRAAFQSRSIQEFSRGMVVPATGVQIPQSHTIRLLTRNVLALAGEVSGKRPGIGFISLNEERLKRDFHSLSHEVTRGEAKRYQPSRLLKKSLCSYCVMMLGRDRYHGTHVEVRGQLLRVCSLLPPLHGC